MTKYTPFLKLKVNEVGAVAALADDVKALITPFFDLPVKNGMTSTTFCQMVTKAARKIAINIGKTKLFYLDNFDIPDAITVNGETNYRFVIDKFIELNFVPVIGLDRAPSHNLAVFSAKEESKITSDSVAIRILEDEFASFELVEDELHQLVDSALVHFKECVLILDCRMCLKVNASSHAAMLAQFIQAAETEFAFSEIIVTGSSVPAAIGEVSAVEQQSNLTRIELKIFGELRRYPGMQEIGFGDYTVVSPLYSEVTLPPEILLNITAPKMLYAHGNFQYIARGGALKTHERGNYQYNDIAADIISKPFYRGAGYSYGDEFLDTKSKMIGNKVTPSTVLNPIINAHITYMATDHPLLA